MEPEEEQPPSTVSEGQKVSTVGRYRLFAELARGGMGIVYLALVRGPGNFNKLFVVKVLKAHLAEDPVLVRMFLEEARLAAKLSHPNVVQTIEVGSDARRHFIAMEFLDGQSFYSVLARAKESGSVMPLHYQLHVLVHLLEGLQYAHDVADFDGSRLGLVHRDVSPHNVLLSYDGQVKILDFGIAKAFDSSNDTRTGVLKGKIAYMAPEQAAGEALDRRADVFAVGVMLWETIVGRRMWDRSLRDMQILHALMKAQIPRPIDHAPDIDPRVERIILKATAANADDRYPSAGDMQRDLEEYLRERGAPSFGSRDVGRYVTELFSEERERIKTAVDEQISILRGTASGAYSQVAMRTISRTPVVSGTPSGMQVSFSEPGAETISASGAMLAPRALPPARATLPPPGRVRRRRRTLLAALAGGGLVLAGAIAFRGALLASLRGAEPAQPASASTMSSVPPAPASASTPASSSASEPLTPPASSSQAEKTEAPRPSSAPVASASWNAARHPVATAAPLRPATTATAQVPTATTAAPASAPAPSTAPTPSAHVRQQIDTSNPYGH